MADLPRYSVIREHRFEEELRGLISDAKAADEFVEGAEFVLARDPSAGSRLADNIWFLPMATIEEMQVSLYYTFDESTVRLLSIGTFGEKQS